MQAAELIKLITQTGKPLINKLLTYSVSDQDLYIIELTKQSAKRDSHFPSGKSEFEHWDYEIACTGLHNEIDDTGFEDLKGKATIVDVREYGELPEITSFPHLHIPLSNLENRLGEIVGEQIIFICQTGVRSRKAMELFSSRSHAKSSVYSLKGGILKLTMSAT